VAELRAVVPTVVAVLASEGACDGVAAPAGATSCRVAPREVLLVGDLSSTDVRVDEPRAIVEDVTDGWAVLEIAGDDAVDAFARLSELELPSEGFVQGEVARIGAKLVVEPGRITILVPAMFGAFLEERIRSDCAEVLA
jgi:hypothetical protein